jgi:hypothetical protein
LQFHHELPREKTVDVASVVKRGWSLKRLLKELSSCVVLCANCHAKLHWNEKQ